MLVDCNYGQNILAQREFLFLIGLFRLPAPNTMLTSHADLPRFLTEVTNVVVEDGGGGGGGGGHWPAVKKGIKRTAL